MDSNKSRNASAFGNNPWWILVALLALLALLIIVFFLIIALRPSGWDDYRASPAYETMPCDFPNTKWVCQEEDSFFIVDRHGESRGETTVDGEPMFFSLDFAPSLSRPSRIFAFVLPYAKNWPEIWRAQYTGPDPFFVGEIDCQADQYQIIVPATSSSSSAEETRTLHFVREDLDEKVDFYGPYCSICKRENDG